MRELFALGRTIHGVLPDPGSADLEAEQIEQLREERMRRGIANIRGAALDKGGDRYVPVTAAWDSAIRKS